MFRILDAPLSLSPVVDAVAAKGHGALVTFVGAVRDATSGQRVLRLEYEAHAPMAEKVLKGLARECEARWPGIRVACDHRVGTLFPGDWAVVVAVSSPHRQAAFDACAHYLERLKQDVPIWKKEHFESGAVWVGMGP